VISSSVVEKESVNIGKKINIRVERERYVHAIDLEMKCDKN
jgi:hypothetical protein